MAVSSPWVSFLAEEQLIWLKGGVQHLVAMAPDDITLTTENDDEDDMTAVVNYGGTVQYIHGYFSNYEPRRCCLLLTSGQSSPETVRLVRENNNVETSRGFQTLTALPELTSVTQSEFLVYQQALLAVHFPVLSAPPPPPDYTPNTSPDLPITTPTPRKYHGKSPLSSPVTTLTCMSPDSNYESGSDSRFGNGFHDNSLEDVDLSVIPVETMSEVLRKAFRLSGQLASQLDKLAYEPYRKKSNAKILAEELVFQLSQLENNTCPYYNFNSFMSSADFKHWQREQRAAISKKMNRFWHLSLPSLRSPNDKQPCYHDNYKYLLRKLIRYEERLKQGAGKTIPVLPLSGASQRILLEFALRYGIGDLYRRTVYLEYLTETYNTEMWYLVHASQQVAALLHLRVKVKVVVTKEEFSKLLQCCSSFLRYTQRTLSQFRQQSRPKLSTAAIGIILELISSVLELQNSLAGGATEPESTLQKIVTQAVVISVQNLYAEHRRLATRHLKLESSCTPTPKLLNCMMNFMKDELLTFKTHFGRLFRRYPTMLQEVAQVLYSQLMTDVSALYSSEFLTNKSEEVDLTVVSLAYKLNQLDKEWASYIEASMQIWRQGYSVFIDHLMAALESHVMKLILQAVANDKFSKVELPTRIFNVENHLCSDSQDHHHGNRCASAGSRLSNRSTNSMTHSTASPFMPFVRGGVAVPRAVSSSPLCTNGQETSKLALEEDCSPIIQSLGASGSSCKRSSLKSDIHCRLSKRFCVTTSALDVSVIVQRLVRLYELLSNSLYPAEFLTNIGQTPTPKSQGNTAERLVGSGGVPSRNLSSSGAMSGRISPEYGLAGQHRKLLAAFTKLIQFVFEMYRTNMAAMDLCATPVQHATDIFGQQFIEQLWAEKDEKRVWGCRHMVEQLPKCLPEVDLRKAKYLADCFTPVDQKMCLRINNLVKLSGLVPHFVHQMAAQSSQLRIDGSTLNQKCSASCQTNCDTPQKFMTIFHAKHSEHRYQLAGNQTDHGTKKRSDDLSSSPSESDTGFSESELLRKIDESTTPQNDSSAGDEFTKCIVKAEINCETTEIERSTKIGIESQGISRDESQEEVALSSTENLLPIIHEISKNELPSLTSSSEVDRSTFTSNHDKRDRKLRGKQSPPVTTKTYNELPTDHLQIVLKSNDLVYDALSDSQIALTSVSRGLSKLLTWRLHKYTQQALALLLDVHPTSLDVSTNFRPLGEYLRTNVAALRAWLTVDCYRAVTRGLYRLMAQDTEKHALALKNFPNTAENRAKVLLRVCAYLMEVIQKADTESDIDYLTACWEVPTLWLAMYSYPSYDLMCLFDALHDMTQVTISAGTHVVHKLYWKLYADLLRTRKCFSNRELRRWIQRNWSICIETVQVLNFNGQDRDNVTQEDIVASLLQCGVLVTLDSSANKSAEDSSLALLDSWPAPVVESVESAAPTQQKKTSDLEPGQHLLPELGQDRVEACRSSPEVQSESCAFGVRSRSGRLRGSSRRLRGLEQGGLLLRSEPNERRKVSPPVDADDEKAYSDGELMWFGGEKPVSDKRKTWFGTSETKSRIRPGVLDDDKTASQCRRDDPPNDGYPSLTVGKDQSSVDVYKKPPTFFYTLRDVSSWDSDLDLENDHDLDNMQSALGVSSLSRGPRESRSDFPAGDAIQLQYFLERRVTLDLVLSILAARSLHDDYVKDCLKNLPAEMISPFNWLSAGIYKSKSFFSWLGIRK